MTEKKLQKNKAASAKSSELIDQRRRQISDAAVRVFSQKGYHAATVQEVADEANLGKGTLYEYIRSKKELLLLVVQEGHRQIIDGIRESAGVEKSPEKKIRAIISTILDFMDQHIVVARSIIPVVHGLANKEMAKIWEDHEEMITLCADVLKEGIKKGDFREVDPVLTAELMLHICWHWCENDLPGRRNIELNNFKELITGIFLEGIKSRKPAAKRSV